MFKIFAASLIAVSIVAAPAAWTIIESFGRVESIIRAAAGL